MTKWAALTVMLYIILVLVVLLPVVFWTFDSLLGKEAIFSSVFSIICLWQYWIFIAIVFAIQAALLLFPVKIDNGTGQPQRDIRVTLVAAALLFSVLLLAIIWMILMGIFGDRAFVELYHWITLSFLIISWIIWSILFARIAKHHAPQNLFDKIIQWLIKGSILELLIAVPSHIIVRRREQCCAPGMTFMGITAGIAIMTVAFGPSVYFLFKKRFNQMKPKSKRNI